MALPVILFVVCGVAAALANQGMTAPGLVQAFLTFALAWIALAAWFAKRADAARQAGQDEATGLMASGAFTRRLREEMARRQRYGGDACLVLVRLAMDDGMDQRHGQGARAQAMAAAAAAMKHATRGVDVLARPNADSLALLLPDTPVKGATRAAEKVLAAFSRQKVRLPDGSHLGGLAVNLGGVALSSKPESMAALMQRAEAALLKARERGRNTVEIAR